MINHIDFTEATLALFVSLDGLHNPVFPPLPGELLGLNSRLFGKYLIDQIRQVECLFGYDIGEIKLQPLVRAAVRDAEAVNLERINRRQS